MGRLYELEYFALNLKTGEIELNKSDDYIDATDLCDAQKKVNLLENPFFRLSGNFIESFKGFGSELLNSDEQGERDILEEMGKGLEEEELKMFNEKEVGEDKRLVDVVKAFSYDQFLDWCETMLPDLEYLDSVLEVISSTTGLTKYKNALKAFLKNEREKLDKDGESKKDS